MEKNIDKDRNYWKIVAIVLLLIVIIETAFIGYAYKTNMDYINNEGKCSNEICFNLNSDSFIYDDSIKTCSCFTGGKEIYREILP